MKREWPSQPLGDVCDVIGGGTPPKDNPSFYGGTIPWATVRDMRSEVIDCTEHSITAEAVNASATNIIPKNNVVIATRVGLGKVCLLAQETAINQDLRGIVPKSEKVQVRFLFHWLKFVAPQIIEEGTGATVQGVKLPFIKALQLPIPPKIEQERIVAILDEALAGLTACDKAIRSQLLSSRELFEHERTQVFKNAATEWPMKTLEVLCDDITVGYVGPMRTEYRETGIPFLRSQNVRAGSISLDNLVFVDQRFESTISKSRLRPGDLAVVRTGYSGTAAVIPPDLHISNCSDLVIVRPGSQLNAYYLEHFFNSAHGKRLVLGKLNGAAQKHFNIGAAKKVLIALPSMLEQKHAVETLEKVRLQTDKLAAVQQKKLTALSALKQSLLHQAFSGNL